MAKFVSILIWGVVIVGCAVVGMSMFRVTYFSGADRVYYASQQFIAKLTSGDVIEQGFIILVVGVVIWLVISATQRSI